MRLNNINPTYFCDGCGKKINMNGPHIADRGEQAELHYHSHECLNKYNNEVKDSPFKCVPATIARISQHKLIPEERLYMSQEQIDDIVKCMNDVNLSEKTVELKEDQEMQGGMTVHRFPLEKRSEVEPWPVAVPWSPLVEHKPEEEN